jgi:phosphopantetheine--protein transferase-like protein
MGDYGMAADPSPAPTPSALAPTAPTPDDEAPSAPPLAITARRLVPHGRLAAVALPATVGDAALQALLASARRAMPADEWALAESFALPRRLAFVGGRLALRDALASIAPEHATSPVLRTARGAPQLPDGLTGSVSHKRRLAVAIAARASDAVRTVGVDVEEVPTAAELERPDLAPKILTPLERHELAPLAETDALAYREAVRLRFALKEAVYKAIDPHVHRYVRFQEVEVFPGAGGAVAVRLALPEFAGRHITVQAWWARLEGHLVATAAGSTISE